MLFRQQTTLSDCGLLRRRLRWPNNYLEREEQGDLLGVSRTSNTTGPMDLFQSLDIFPAGNCFQEGSIYTRVSCVCLGNSVISSLKILLLDVDGTVPKGCAENNRNHYLVTTSITATVTTTATTRHHDEDNVTMQGKRVFYAHTTFIPFN